MVVPLRQLERRLFSAWWAVVVNVSSAPDIHMRKVQKDNKRHLRCGWLCYPGAANEDQRARKLFEQTLRMVDDVLQAPPGPFFLESFSVVDCVFAPFLERMSASLFYYKGFTLRDRERPAAPRTIDSHSSLASFLFCPSCSLPLLHYFHSLPSPSVVFFKYLGR